MKEISPKKRFGQNFINDEVLLSDLVDLIKVKKNDDFLEIGPGSGNLTSLILSSANSCSSVEIDRDLISLLKERFKKNDNFKIINENILNFDLKKYVSNFAQTAFFYCLFCFFFASQNGAQTEIFVSRIL